MRKYSAVAVLIFIGFGAHAAGNLKSRVARMVFTKFKTDAQQIQIKADCSWKLNRPASAECKLNYSNQFYKLTGQEAVALRDAGLVLGAGEASGAGKSWFRDPQILNCTRRLVPAHYVKKSKGHKAWVKDVLDYDCSMSPEVAPAPPEEPSTATPEN